MTHVGELRYLGAIIDGRGIITNSARDKYEFIGRGLYTPSDAARLTGASAGQISRWLYGHSRRRNGKLHQDKEIWKPEISLNSGKVLSFLDLVEVRAVHNFLHEGVSARLVRAAREFARQEGDVPYPFSSGFFKTDGARIFAEKENILAEKEKNKGGVESVTDVKTGQDVFRKVIEQTFRNLDMKNNAPTRWWVGSDFVDEEADRKSGIVIDPKISFGQPIDYQTSVPAEVLYDAVQANKGSFEIVARDFDIPQEAIQNAYEFQKRLAA